MPTKLFVGNLPYRTSEDDIRGMFEEHGDVVSVKLAFDRETQRSRGFAFVEMDRYSDAEAAIETLHETEIAGRKIFVELAKSPQPDAKAETGGASGVPVNPWYVLREIANLSSDNAHRASGMASAALAAPRLPKREPSKS